MTLDAVKTLATKLEEQEVSLKVPLYLSIEVSLTGGRTGHLRCQPIYRVREA